MMALHLLHKRDLVHAGTLTEDEEEALRKRAGKDESEDVRAAVLEVLVRAHTEGLWLACDCRGEGGRPPISVP